MLFYFILPYSIVFFLTFTAFKLVLCAVSKTKKIPTCETNEVLSYLILSYKIIK